MNGANQGEWCKEACQKKEGLLVLGARNFVYLGDSNLDFVSLFFFSGHYCSLLTKSSWSSFAMLVSPTLMYLNKNSIAGGGIYPKSGKVSPTLVV